MKFAPFCIVCCMVAVACGPAKNKSAGLPEPVISQLGDTLHLPAQPLPDELRSRIDSLSQMALQQGNKADYHIWRGRLLAYEGNYHAAIQLFTDAIAQFPDDARAYRHRGHRYITIRRFDLAIQDFLTATRLFENQKDEVEPDGLPNAADIPLSTLQTNTWYHLGLAYYLTGRYDLAIPAYQKGIEISTNDDMRIAFQYWYYLALRKAGRDTEAGQLIAAVPEEIDLIENTSYHKLLMVFKGVFKADELLSGSETELENSTLGYGLGFWHAINGRHERAREIWQAVYDSQNSAPFGYIASEVALAGAGQQ